MQPNPPKKFFDITPPTPSATSRPVITSNRSVTDPTIKKIEVNIGETAVQPTQLPQFTPLTHIQPSAEMPNATPAVPTASLARAKEPVFNSAPLNSTPPAEVPKFGAMQSKIDAHPLFSGQKDPSPKKRGRFIKKLMWFLAILLVLASGVYAAIDSGAINTNINLPFHIFNQASTTATPTISANSSTDPYANWNTYTSTIGGFNFKYPSTAKIEGFRGELAVFPSGTEGVAQGNTGVINGQEDQIWISSNTGSTNNFTLVLSVASDLQKLQYNRLSKITDGTQTSLDNGLAVWQTNQAATGEAACPNSPQLDLISNNTFYYQLTNKLYLGASGTFCFGDKLSTTYTYDEQTSSQDWQNAVKIIKSIKFE